MDCRHHSSCETTTLFSPSSLFSSTSGSSVTIGLWSMAYGLGEEAASVRWWIRPDDHRQKGSIVIPLYFLIIYINDDKMLQLKTGLRLLTLTATTNLSWWRTPAAPLTG